MLGGKGRQRRNNVCVTGAWSRMGHRCLLLFLQPQPPMGSQGEQPRRRKGGAASGAADIGAAASESAASGGAAKGAAASGAAEGGEGGE